MVELAWQEVETALYGVQHGARLFPEGFHVGGSGAVGRNIGRLGQLLGTEVRQVRAPGRTVQGSPEVSKPQCTRRGLRALFGPWNRASGAQPSRCLFALLLWTLVLSGCGSTVAGRTVSGQSTTGSGLEAEPSGGLGGTVGSGGSTSSGSESLAGNRAAAQQNQFRPPTGNQPVDVGVFVVKNGDQAAFAAGYNVAFGDQVAEVDAIVEDINTRGGLLGRRVRPIYSYLDPASSASYDSQAQAACTNWTQDHHVIAVIHTTQSNKPMIACLRANSIPLIPAAVFQWPNRYFQENPLLVTPSSPNQDQAAGIYVDQLASQQFFAATSPTQPTKIGLIIFDDPVQHEVVRNSLKPALARHNLAIAETAAITYPQSGADTATSAREVQGVALKFNTENITHVLFLDSKGLMPLFFMPAAESQNYRPQYGLSSYSDPGYTLQGTVPNAQLRNSKGVGWGATHDVNIAQNPGLLSPPARHCLALMQKAGQQMSKQSAAERALGFCDGFYLLQAAINQGGQLSPEGFRVGLESLQSSFIPAATFATTFGPDRRAGPSGYRRFAFFDDCNCFRYTSDTFSIMPATHSR